MKQEKLISIKSCGGYRLKDNDSLCPETIFFYFRHNLKGLKFYLFHVKIMNSQLVHLVQSKISFSDQIETAT